MTGELTLRGKVLPIGGLKEKILAAHRAGIKTILIPRQNERDLEDVPPELLQSIEIIPVDTAEEVLDRALEPLPSLASPARARRAANRRGRAAHWQGGRQSVRQVGCGWGAGDASAPPPRRAHSGPDERLQRQADGPGTVRTSPGPLKN